MAASVWSVIAMKEKADDYHVQFHDLDVNEFPKHSVEHETTS